MLSQLFNIIAPVALCTLVGYLWGRIVVDYPTEFVTRLIMNVGAPCLLISVMAQVDVALLDFLEVALVAFAMLLITLLLGSVVLKGLGWPVHLYLPSIGFSNSGNMGLPLCLFAFGQQGLALGLAIFVVFMVTQFTVGVLIADPQRGSVWTGLRNLFVQPVVYGALLALAMLVWQWTLPEWALHTVDMLGSLAIPLMLITLGVSLARLQTSHWRRSLAVSVMRIGGGVMIAWLCVVLFDLTGAARGVILLQGVMPTAVFNYLIARRYGEAGEAVAGVVVTSTLISFAAVPLLLWWVLSTGQ